MNQDPLFVETINEALREVIKQLGGAKKVGQKMRPEKTVDEAARWLLDCVNPDRRERLDPDQVLWLLQQAHAQGCHVAMRFIAAECGYEAKPLDPQDEGAELQRQFIASVAMQKAILARMEKLSAPVPLSVAK